MPDLGGGWRDDDDERLVPLFALTGGRAHPSISQLNLGSLVKASLARTSGLEREQAQIIRLCRQWLSIAEVSAHLKVPLAVIKVQVSDLIEHGAMEVSSSTTSMAAMIDQQTLQTLLDGLRAM